MSVHFSKAYHGVLTGRDVKSVVKIAPSSRPVDKFPDRRHLPSRPAVKSALLYFAVPFRRNILSRCTLPSRLADIISPVGNYRPVPSRYCKFTVPSRHQKLHRCHIKSSPADTTSPFPSGRLWCPSSVPTHSHQKIRNHEILSFTNMKLDLPFSFYSRSCAGTVMHLYSELKSKLRMTTFFFSNFHFFP